MPKSGQFTEYRCGICENTKWDQKSHLTSHKRTKTHKDQQKILKLELEKITPEERQTKYGEIDIKKIIKNKVELVRTNRPPPPKPFTRYKRSHHIVYKRCPQEIEEKRQEEEFKSLFMSQLNKWHNLLRGCSVTGEDALDDILYCLFICYLSPKVSTEGDFDLGNSKKSCYKGTIQRKVKDWITKLNIDYLIENTAELVTTKEENSSIYKCGELMSRHPMTKGLIKNKRFINCKNKLILSQLLKDCRDFSTTHNIFNKIDIIGIAWEYFNTKHGGNGGASKERGQYFTERPLMGMCCQLIEPSHIEELGIDNESTLGDEFCATFGFPLYAKKFLNQKFNISIQDKKMYGVEFADRLSRFGIMNAMFSLTNFKHIRSGDSFVTNVSPHLDVSVHNVPFGKSMNCKNIKESYHSERAKEDSHLPEFKDVVPIEKNGDAMLSCQVVLYKTKKMGLVIIKDGEETTGVRNAKWREWFCDSCVIHKIMKIPTGAFSHTGTKTVCVYFTKRNGQKTEKIQFLEMSDTGDKITEICEVTRDDLQQNNYSWDPNVYIVDEEMEKLMASSDCEWKKLGEVCEIIYGDRITKKKEHNPNGLYSVYGGGNCSDCFRVDRYNREGETCKISRFAASLHNCVLLLNHKYFLNDSGLTLNCNTQNLNHKYMSYYMYYSLNNNKTLFKSLYRGADQQNLDITQFKNIDIPIPPQETQTQVVQTLDDLANQRQNYMDIRDGLERRMKYYFEMMIKRHRGEITMEKLGDVTPIVIGSTPSTKENKYWETGTHIWVSVRELNNTTIPITNSVKKLTDTAISECNPRLVKKGSILMSFKLSIGKMAIAGCDLYTNEAIVHINTNNELSNKWLYYYYLCYPPSGASGSIGGGSLNKGKLKKIEFINMPDNIKIKIVQYLDNLETEKNKITETLHQLDTEMREILTQSYQSIDTSDEQVQKLQQITADPLPISPGEWQGDV